ncbi:hypothetical protein AB4144_13405 [Rhizobiaceae sp. 2RAB30]
MGSASLHGQVSAGRARFLVGRDVGGRWIVRDEKDLVGGLFVDRESAVRFAMAESGYVPGAVTCVPDGTLCGFRCTPEPEGIEIAVSARPRRAA